MSERLYRRDDAEIKQLRVRACSSYTQRLQCAGCGPAGVCKTLIYTQVNQQTLLCMMLRHGLKNNSVCLLYACSCRAGDGRSPGLRSAAPDADEASSLAAEQLSHGL